MGNPAGWNSGTLDTYAKDRDKAGNAEKDMKIESPGNAVFPGFSKCIKVPRREAIVSTKRRWTQRVGS